MFTLSSLAVVHKTKGHYWEVASWTEASKSQMNSSNEPPKWKANRWGNYGTRPEAARQRVGSQSILTFDPQGRLSLLSVCCYSSLVFSLLLFVTAYNSSVDYACFVHYDIPRQCVAHRKYYKNCVLNEWINEPGKSTKVWVGKWDAEAGERRGTHGSLRWDASSLDMGEKSFL